jgi:hypothetical protein
LTASKIAEVDKCLASWRQGDVVRSRDEPLQFIHLADLDLPTTLEAEEFAATQASDPDGLAMVGVDVLGLVVLTQTCDLVRSCKDRPYAEVCPLVEIPDEQATLMRRGRIPRLAALPALSNGNNLAADLDRVMTIEKGALALMTDRRERGVETEIEAQIFAEFLGLKRTRAALPNEFTNAVSRMRNRIVSKHSVNSPEGQFLRAIKEIRVRGIPDWSAELIEVEFIFVFDRQKNIPKDAGKWVQQLTSSVVLNDRIVHVEGRSVGLDQLSTAAYLDSSRLDLDHLSWG